MPAPSVSGTSGCNDVDGGNVRVNQECTNQSDAAFLGRGQGQNERASTGVFLGDYMGLAVGPDGIAYPIWTDTRNPVFSPSTGGDVRQLVPAGQGTDIYMRALPG